MEKKNTFFSSHLDMTIFTLQTALPGLSVAPAYFAHDFRSTTTPPPTSCRRERAEGLHDGDVVHTPQDTKPSQQQQQSSSKATAAARGATRAGGDTGSTYTRQAKTGEIARGSSSRTVQTAPWKLKYRRFFCFFTPAEKALAGTAGR